MYMNSTEEQTKQSLVVPFIEALGYNTRKLKEVQWENAAANGRVDCKIINGTSAILVECKKLGIKIGDTAVKQLASYFNSCQDDNKVGIITDGEKYLLFTDMIKEGYMDSKPFLSFSVTDIKDSDIVELEKLSKENFNEYRVGLERNYVAFESVCNDVLNQLKNGSISNEIIELIVEQSDLKNYQDMFDMGRLKKIMQKQVEIFTKDSNECDNGKDSQGTKDLSAETYSMIKNLGFDLEDDDDEDDGYFMDDTEEITLGTALENMSRSVVSIEDAIKSGNNHNKFTELLVGNRKIQLKNNRQLLKEIVVYAMGNDAENVDKIVNAYWHKKTFAVRYGKDMDKYRGIVEPIYIEEYNVSIMIVASNNVILKNAVDVLHLCNIDTSNIYIELVKCVK